MALWDIFRAMDYVGGKPVAGNILTVDANGRFTQSTPVNSPAATSLSANILGQRAGFPAIYGSNVAVGAQLSVGNSAYMKGAYASQVYAGVAAYATAVYTPNAYASAGYIPAAYASNVNVGGAVSVPTLQVATVFSAGNKIIQQSGASLGFFAVAALVGVQTSTSVINSAWQSLHTNASLSLDAAVNGLAAKVNSIDAYLRNLGLFA